LWPYCVAQIAVVFKPRAGDEQEHENNHQPLLGLGEHEEIEEASHRAA
jgi:hypothetical protein